MKQAPPALEVLRCSQVFEYSAVCLVCEYPAEDPYKWIRLYVDPGCRKGEEVVDERESDRERVEAQEYDSASDTEQIAEDTSSSRPKRESISQARLNANRANAQKATGPRTEKGKAVSSRNATKHGMLSKRLLLPGEDEDAFERLYVGMMQSFRPKGVAEEECVERMIAATWRRRRGDEVERDLWDWEGIISRKGRRPSDAFWTAENSDQGIAKISRYMVTYEREFSRALQALKMLKSAPIVLSREDEAELVDVSQITREPSDDAVGAENDAEGVAAPPPDEGGIEDPEEERYLRIKAERAIRREVANIGSGRQSDVEILQQQPFAEDLLGRLSPEALLRLRGNLGRKAENLDVQERDGEETPQLDSARGAGTN